MSAAKPLNYTTTVPVSTSVGEVQGMLAAHGARQVMLSYDDDRQPCGVAFTLDTPAGRRSFALPVNITAMHDRLCQPAVIAQVKRARRNVADATSWEQAARVAWRVIKDWLEAQLALIAAEMSTIDEVLLPWLVIDQRGTTLAQRYQSGDLAALDAGAGR